MNTIFRRAAVEFAIQHHGIDYFDTHLIHVANIALAYWDETELKSKYTKDQVFAIAVLHDTIEDTDATKETIHNLFGFIVADAVYRVSDEEGANRKERKAKTYPKIRFRSLSVFIKLCDRLHNIKRHGKLSMYRKEHESFKAALYIKGEFDSLWDEIEKLLGV